MDPEREKIVEKRSSLRSWRERGGKITHQNELIGIALLAVIFLALVIYPYLITSGGNGSSPVEQQKIAPASIPSPGKTSISKASIPAPSIKIDAPTNTTYNTSTPPLSFIVASSNLDTVLLSVDGGENIAVPHDGTIARIDFAKLNPLFIEDFSGRDEKWNKGAFSVIDGEYVSSNGDSIVGNKEMSDYIVESKMMIKDESYGVAYFGVRRNEMGFYGVHTILPKKEIRLVKSPPYTILSSAIVPDIIKDKFSLWKIEAIGNKLKVYVDGVKYIEFTDNVNPILNGSVIMMPEKTLTHYDDIMVYRYLADGTHNLTIVANNTAGNIFSKTVYFAINTTLPKREEKTIGKMGVPLIANGFEITVKSVNSAGSFINIWLSIKNLEDKEKPFKLGPGTIIIDNAGQQYENIKVPRSAEIAQTSLYPRAIREGAVFFEKLYDGRSSEKLVLYINGDKVEFILDANK